MRQRAGDGAVRIIREPHLTMLATGIPKFFYRALSEKALENAATKLDGAEYKEVCCLRTQIVSGTNYCLLCEITPVVPNAESHFAIVFVYEDLDGNAQITDVFDFFAE